MKRLFNYFLVLSLVLTCIAESNAALKLDMTKEEKLEFFEICNNDIQAYCDHIEPGEGKLFFCLSKRLDTLEVKCKNVVVKQLYKTVEE